VTGCLPDELIAGETYSIPFVLLPSAWGGDGSKKVVKRYITIDPACPPGERLCSDVCSPVPCNLLQLPEGQNGDGEDDSLNRVPAGTAIELLGPPKMMVSHP
jgi:hypothetical protein